MKTHFIGELEEFGILTNNYAQFLEKRSKLISRELKKRIIERDIDKQGQVSTGSDYEEETTSYQ